MGAIVAVEGLDGAGKATLVAALADAARARGATVATRAFPRYGADVHAALAGEALRGAHGDVGTSVHGMALLFALDRRDAAAELAAAARDHDLVLVDRYVASNAAYGAARCGEDADGAFVAWVRATEVERFGVPVPTAQVLVRVPREVAAARVLGRAAADPDRAPDGFESDAALQARCADVYDQLVAGSWLAPWHVAEAGGGPASVTRTALSVLAGCPDRDWTAGVSGCGDTIGT